MSGGDRRGDLGPRRRSVYPVFCHRGDC